jgi:hypothetical protein
VKKEKGANTTFAQCPSRFASFILLFVVCCLLYGAGSEHRVLRGGAFNNEDRNVRCAYRNRNNPNNWNRNIGFRLSVRTFFLRRNCQALRLSGFLAETKNGGAYSGPHPATAASGE